METVRELLEHFAYHLDYIGFRCSSENVFFIWYYLEFPSYEKMYDKFLEKYAEYAVTNWRFYRDSTGHEGIKIYAEPPYKEEDDA